MSNVEFKTIDYIKLENLRQYVDFVNIRYKKDKEEDTQTITYLHVDEAGSAFNSRSFKDNFDALSIKTLLTARHFKSAIIITSQRYTLVDALLRNICNKCISCNKKWRFQRLYYYDAYELENAQNPALIQPYHKTCWFITNKSFEKYDTYQLVEDIEKKCKNGDMLTEEQILANKQTNINTDAVLNHSKKFIKTRKKMFK